MSLLPNLRPGALRDTLAQRWHALGRRERRSVQLALAVATIGLAGGFLESLLAERQRLAVRLPAKQAELARLHAAANEIAELRQRPPIAADASAGTPPADALGIDGLGAQQLGLTLAVNPGRDDRIAFSGRAEAGVVLDWLAALHGERGLAVHTLSITTRADRDEVSGTLIPRAEP